MTLLELRGYAALVLLPAAAFGQAHEWGYEKSDGPAKWATLNPEYAICGSGKEQSPVNIQGAKSIDLPPIEVHYHPAPLKVIDNGHTIQVDYAPGSTMNVGGKTYELQQFHFHHPAENRLMGKSFPMEVHLVHKDPEGHIAVIGVFIKIGADNPVVHQEFANLPQEKGTEINVANITVDATALLPANRGYITFPGSLTTPPCSEHITWFVMKEPMTVTQEEFAAFAKRYPRDARPVQPLNGRPVQASK